MIQDPVRPTRRMRGIAQNFANQLAQMAVGVEAMFLGSALKREPPKGMIEIDVLSASALINGRVARLALTGYLHEWVRGELGRKRLDPGWLEIALVRIHYSRDRDAGGADFDAAVLVRSSAGVFRGSFSNGQALVGAWRRRG